MKLSALCFALAPIAILVSAKEKPPRKTCRNYVRQNRDKYGNENVYAGRTYEEWANYWVNWEFSFNATVDPSADKTGIYAYENQPGGVFLLAGSNGQAGIDRFITIPRDTPSFLPMTSNLVNFLSGNASDPRLRLFFAATLPSVGINVTDNLTLAELSSLFAQSFCSNAIYNIALRIDGCNIDPFQNGLIYTSPDRAFELQPNPDYGIPADNFDAVQCGYYAILAPLKPGNHTIHSVADEQPNNNTKFWVDALNFGNFNFTSDVTYHITVI